MGDNNNYSDEGYATCPKHLGLNVDAPPFVPGPPNVLRSYKVKNRPFIPKLTTIHEVEENAGYAEYLTYLENKSFSQSSFSY